LNESTPQQTGMYLSIMKKKLSVSWICSAVKKDMTWERKGGRKKSRERRKYGDE
jgi:hypothetical protein